MSDASQKSWGVFPDDVSESIQDLWIAATEVDDMITGLSAGDGESMAPSSAFVHELEVIELIVDRLADALARVRRELE